MDQDKPFKTIEVIDSRTQQACKVACMSCIRGHRTTSCGIPVCRSKIFWTVKRPGRPSNSCNCRYGASGGCRCVVARTACPHKSKKGEKRSGECRCDEQGRYCCLIEPEQWGVLMALGKPMVEFYPHREALEARFAAPTPRSMAMTPQTHTFISMPGSPAPLDAMQISSPYTGYQSPPAVLAPRFGMMGIGAPQGNEQGLTPDLLSWDGHTPQAPREYRQSSYQALPAQEEQRSCCQGPASPPPPQSYPSFTSPLQTPSLPLQHTFAPFGGVMPAVSMPSAPPQSTFNLDKLNMDYLNYQFPSAICQTCGLNGCTCRNCPPVMQNFSNGSWAQCCGRKHARTAAYVAPATEVAFAGQHIEPETTHGQPLHLQQQQQQQTMPMRTGHDIPNIGISHQPQPADLAPRDFCQEQLFHLPPQEPQHQPPNLQSPTSIPDFMPFDPGEAFALPESNAGDMDLSEFLVQELERPPEEAEAQEGGSGGCCCSHD